MDDAEIRSLLLDIESDRAERTTSTDKTDKFGEAMCTFANDLPNHGRPGYLFVGVGEDGRPSGAAITDRLLQSLAAIRADGNLLPAPTVNVARKDFGEGAFLVVEVFPSDLPPVRYKGTVWVRVGPRRARATEADERALSDRRVARARTWDARASSYAEASDLALALFEAYRMAAVDPSVIAENHRPIEQQLASLRFWDRHAGRPTHAAVLLFGKDVLGSIPGAYVQYVRYDGTRAADVLRERRFEGDLLSVLRELQSLAAEIENARPVAVGPMQETTVADYPAAALREVLVNAIIHRDYESNTPVVVSHFADRIEVQNPGGLYDIRPDDFPGATAYRNPILAEAAKTLGFVNRFGRGVPRTLDVMRRNGSPEPEFLPKERHFLVVLRRRP